MSFSDDVSQERFVADILRNENNGTNLRELPELRLPEACLVADSLFQTVWNIKAGRPPADGIKDYDIFYFDAADVSAESEMKRQPAGRDTFRGTRR